MRLVLVASVALGVAVAPSIANVLSPGNLVVFQAGDGSGALANNSPFSVLELTTAPTQLAPVQSFAISVNNNMWTSATATSTGYLSLSEDRSSVQWDAHTVRAAAGANENTITARGAGSLSNLGNFTLLTSYTGTSGNQARSAALMTSGDLFIADQGGLYASGGAAPALAGNFRDAHSFGGVVYVSQASATLPMVSSVSGTPGAPVTTGLPSIGSNASFQDFYMVSSANDSNFDLMYVTTTTTINKFHFEGGAWVAKGTAATGGFFGIAAEANPAGPGFALFVTTGTGAANANSVKEFIDSAAPGATISLDAGTTLFTTSNNTTLKGIELAPVPTPSALALLGITSVISLRRRR
jgi:hypothetical protein